MFNLLHYQSQVHQFVDREIKIQSHDLLDRLSDEKIFEFDGKSDITQFPLKILNTLKKIANLRIGQELLTFLCDHKKKSIILQFSEKGSSFSLEKNTINLNPNSFTLWKNAFENQWAHMPFKITFVHELLHCRHGLENREKYMQMGFPTNSQDLLYVEMDDAEEQLAICGINSAEEEAGIVLCENHFRYAWKLPLRFSHRGVGSPKSTIQQNILIEPEQFASLFERYHKKLSPESYRKQALIVKIPEPSSHQQKLMEAIKPFVEIHNIALISNIETINKLETNELFDINFAETS